MRVSAAVLLIVFCTAVAFGQTTFIPQILAFPQIAIGGDADGVNYVTLVQMVNNNSAAITGHVALYADNGSALSAIFDGQGPQSSLDMTLASGEARQIQITLNGVVTAGSMFITYSP